MRAKGTMTLGTKTFYKDEPVLYFDTLKTSSLEGSSTTVYAQGGRGNARLMSWDGEKTTTFTMEDALISPEGLMILAGANLLSAGTDKLSKVIQHVNTIVKKADITEKRYANWDASTSTLTIKLDAKSNDNKDGIDSKVYIDTSKKDQIYVMLMNDGEIYSEPYIGTVNSAGDTITVKGIPAAQRGYTDDDSDEYVLSAKGKEQMSKFDSVMVDYYTEHTSTLVKQIEITADSFGSSFYLEASTLFRNEKGVDVPAEFVIPNCRVQSNFNFSMSGSGDPSTFTFTMDCFPDYTRWEPTRKVLCAIQVIPAEAEDGKFRTATDSNEAVEEPNG